MKSAFSLKRLAALLLAILMVLACVACDTVSEPIDTTAAATTAAPTEPATTEAATEPATEAVTTAPETEPVTTEPETEPEVTTPDTEETDEPDTDPVVPDVPTEPAGKVDTSFPTVEVPDGRIKNIIIIIGDGMGKNHVTASEWATGRSFTFDDWNVVSVNTDSVNTDGTLITEGYTDSAAAATALASGKLTVNYYVGIDHERNEVKTILDYAKEYGKSTGVITTEVLYGATPAGFTAHAPDRNQHSQILVSQMQAGIDLLCGHADVSSTKIKPGIELNGYSWYDAYWMLEEDESYMLADKHYWQFDMALTTTNAPRAYLDDVTIKALDYLDQDEHGFVLMVEQAHIDKFSHNSAANTSTVFEHVKNGVVDLNNTVNSILKWLGDRDDTAILVLADHETGGLLISRDESEYTHQYQAKDGSVFSYTWTSGGSHTNADVNLYTYGFDVDYSEFTYYADANRIKNIDVFNLMYDILTNAPKYD